MSDDLQVLHEFGGVARLFPLPNLVLFPHVAQPLHLFEPRYRQLVTDALEGDRLIAMTLLKPGWEPDYEGSPDLFDVACLGHILTEQRLPDGKFNILLRGVSRLRLEKEVFNDRLYRSAQGWPLPDPPHEDLPDLRRELVELAKNWLPQPGPQGSQIQALLDNQYPLGALADILSFALPLSTAIKQSLLEEFDIEQRVQRLIRALESGSPPELLPPPKQVKWPPEFSLN